MSAAALVLAGWFPGNVADTFGHLAQGRQIHELGHVPPLDTWSLLPGPARPWHNYEWLSDLLYFTLHTALGYDGLLVLKSLLLLSTVLLLCAFARDLAGDRGVILTAIVIVSTIPAVRFRLSDRPHVFGLCLGAAYLFALARLSSTHGPDARRTRMRLVALLFGLHVLWVNLHGSHLLGVAITCAFAALGGAAARPWVIGVLGLEALASCISPYGPAIVLDAIDHVLDARYRGIVTEWAAWAEDDPPWFQLGPALHGVVLTLVAPQLLRATPAARAALAVGALLAVASFRSFRFIAEFMLLSAPLVGAGLALAARDVASRRFATFATAATALLVALVPTAAAGLPPYAPIGHGLSHRGLPHGPGVLLSRAARPPRVFASIEHSWPLMWEAPKARFFVDGRVPFYGPEHMNLVQSCFAEPGVFEQVLRDYDINTVVLQHSHVLGARLRPAMQGRAGWQLALVDDAFALYVREDLARGSGYPRLERIVPDYDLAWALEAAKQAPGELTRELAALAPFETARGFRHWLLALLELSPLRRGAPSAGFRWPREAAEWARYRRAAALLGDAAQRADRVPVVAAIRAVVEATLCNFEAAERSIAQATRELAPAREATLAGLEVALRRGDVERVRGLVQLAMQHPEGRADPWLAEIAQGTSQPPACP